MRIYRLSKSCTVAPQIQPADVATLTEDGYTTVVCNRPDGEDFGQPTAASIAAECERHGIAFYELPVSSAGISPDTVNQFRKIVASSTGPVLAYCRSGQRSSVLWQVSGSP